jgi:cell division transport system ATP-binding protein
MDIKFDNVTKNFGLITALKDLSFEIEKGDFVFVVGPSGSGKSTLIKLILNQMKPTSGEITIDGQNLATLSKNHTIDQIRKNIGVIFQDFQLISDLNLEENIALNLDIVNFPKEKIPSQIDNVLKKVKLTNRRYLFPRV